MSASGTQSPIMIGACEAYARWAPSYDQTPNPLIALEERLLAPMLNECAGCEVVDLGCGTGRWLQRIEAFAPRSLVGVDSSPAMLAEARRKCQLSTFIEADCSSTPLAARSADLVLASFLLSYVQDIDSFVAEAARILRPGGTLIVSDLHPDTRSYGWRRTFRDAGGVFEIATFPYALAALIATLKTAGLALGRIVEARFGEEEASIFRENGMAGYFDGVKFLPVIYWARFSRRTNSSC